MMPASIPTSQKNSLSDLDERCASVLERARRNIGKAISRKLNITLEKDPDVDFEKIIQDAIESYNSRLLLAQETARKRHLEHTSSSDDRKKQRGQATEVPDGTVKVVSPLSPLVLALLADDDELCSMQPPELLQRKLSSLIEKGSYLHSGVRRSVVQLSDDVVVKIGPSLAHEEENLLKYVASHTSIPVPNPLGIAVIGKTSFIFMSRIPGESLEKRWPGLTSEQKTSVRQQLDLMMSDLRQVPHPPHTPLGSLSSPPICKDLRMSLSTSSSIIWTVAEFHDFLLSSPFSDLSPGYIKWLRSLLKGDYRITLTHADFHMRNVMLDESDGHVIISGIIDWEMGGWYPEYWELYKAYNTRDGNDTSDWWDLLPQAILGYDREVAERRVIERSTIG